MSKKLSKKEVEDKIKDFFRNIKNKNPKEIKKIKKLAMSKNIKLGKLKTKFCKKCYSLFNIKNSEIRIRGGFKIVKCKNCDYISRYKLK